MKYFVKDLPGTCYLCHCYHTKPRDCLFAKGNRFNACKDCGGKCNKLRIRDSQGE